MDCYVNPAVHAYKAFGMRISSDLRLPELSQIHAILDHQESDISNQKADIFIAEGCHVDWPSFKQSPHSTKTLTMAPSEWRLEIEGVGWLRVSGGSSIIWERWDDSVSDRDIRTFLITSALGALLIQRGLMPLNATTLARDGKAIMLLGNPASGKSALSWCLMQQGWELLSSELSIVDQNNNVWPGLRHLKLWHDSAIALNLDWQNLPVVRRGLKRYSLLPPSLPVADQAVPLAIIYAIGPRHDTTKQSATLDPEQEELSPSACAIKAFAFPSQRDALLSIRNQVFHPRFYRAMECEAQLFIQASSLVRSSRGYILRAPEGVARMREALGSVDLLKPETIVIDTRKESESFEII